MNMLRTIYPVSATSKRSPPSLHCDMLAAQSGGRGQVGNGENDCKWGDFFAALAKFRIRQDEQKKCGKKDFSILNSVLSRNDEVRLHSRFIYSLLEPNGPHYRGTLFLKLFLENLGLDKDWLDLGAAKVYKEYHHHSDYEDPQGRVDIYITDGTRQIIIENKLNSGDGPGQVYRYLDAANAIKNGNPDDTLFIYLTKGRRAPSDKGLRSKDGKTIKFKVRDGKHILVREDDKPVASYMNLWYKKKHLKRIQEFMIG